MCPLRPSAIASPGATASSIAVLTILSSFPLIAVSSPELLRPSSGSTYLIGGGGATTTLAGGGGAQAETNTRDMSAAGKDFMGTTEGSADCGLTQGFGVEITGRGSGVQITRKRRSCRPGTTSDAYVPRQRPFSGPARGCSF